VRVLFDQNLPHKLRTSLASLGPQHEIVTAAYMGWGELKNGELLKTAEAQGMEVFVTGDGTLAYEQNLTGRRLAIVALSTNNWPIVKNHAPRILAAIDNATPGSFQSVDCGRFSRKHREGNPRRSRR
jgi:predicted nuclease of predicted toxin-antitoxin system